VHTAFTHFAEAHSQPSLGFPLQLTKPGLHENVQAESMQAGCAFRTPGATVHTVVHEPHAFALLLMSVSHPSLSPAVALQSNHPGAHTETMQM
jgi:hypothetical protein